MAYTGKKPIDVVDVTQSQSLTVTDDLVTPSINSGQIGGRRNLIINGAMQVAQRGTDVDNISGNAYHSLDRIRYSRTSVSGLVFNHLQDSDAPDGFGYSMKWTVTTALSSIDAVGRASLNYKIEAQDCQHLDYGSSSAKTTTLSFWVKCSETGVGNVSFYTDDTARMFVGQYTINASDTWEYKTITISGDTDSSGGINNDNGNGIDVLFQLGAGSTNTAGSPASGWNAVTSFNTQACAGQTLNITETSNATWQITGVQLEVGSVATEFEHRSYGEELKLCKRYYTQGLIQHAGAIARRYTNTASSINYGGHFHYETEMRAAATVTVSNATLTGATAIAAAHQFKQGFVLQMTTSGAASYYATAGDFTADAEL